VSTARERIWLASYAEGVPSDITPPEHSLVDMLETSAARFGPRPALEFFGAELTYSQLADRVHRGAEGYGGSVCAPVTGWRSSCRTARNM